MDQRTAAVLALLSLAGVSSACAQRPAARPSILRAPAGMVRVRVLDAASTRPLAGVEVGLWGDNGIRCIRAPCPTDASSWKGQSDAAGFVMIPTAVLRPNTTIEAPGHDAMDIADAESDAGGGWTAELPPKDTAGPGPESLKLVDARTDRPIASTPVRIEYRVAGQTAELATATNALGWVFVPFRVLARAPRDTWLELPGFRRTRVDFSFAQHRMILQRR